MCLFFLLIQSFNSMLLDIVTTYAGRWISADPGGVGYPTARKDLGDLGTVPMGDSSQVFAGYFCAMEFSKLKEKSDVKKKGSSCTTTTYSTRSFKWYRSF
jgi:hypothetical protein